MPTDTQTSATSLLLAVQLREWRGDWAGAAELATLAIQHDDQLTGAYMHRALARRVMGKLSGPDGAIADYDRCIDIDPLIACAWELRGGCRSTLAGRLPREQRIALQTLAEQDYRQAALLEPTNERVALALIEAAICAGRYREAFGYAGEAWSHVRGPSQRVVAAWLGCIAGVLANRPRPTWDRYHQALQVRQAELGALTWCVAEINAALELLQAEGGCAQETLATLQGVQDLFLSHFEDGGPMLR
jgi:tetratricopeptide (TPR) repeat protein